MPLPDTTPDVITLVRRSRVVDDARLEGFLALFRSAGVQGLNPAGVLSLMVEQGLLTRYQANELAAGRWWGFWVGPYRILDRLGRGGMGQVFLAEHARLGKRVALKILSGSLQADADTRTRFVREARAAAALDHPNVVHVYDVDAAHDPPYLVLEYVDGVSLQAAVGRHGALSPGEAAAVGVQVARGLHHAAGVGLIHRDIKPANLLLDRKGAVRILDLGIARFASDPASRVADAGVILGTLDYLAPEQAVDSSTVDARADLYALGGTLYFLLAGHPPFPDADVARKLSLKQHADPVPIHQLRPEVPAGLSDIIHRLLARKPVDRYEVPAAAATALEQWAATGPDFPARLFRPTTADADSVGGPTEPGRDGDSTPVPVTRRIVRPQTPPTPAGCSAAVPAPAAAPDPPADSPTVIITRPIIRAGGSGHLSRRWAAVAAGLFLAAVLAVVLFVRAGAPPGPTPKASGNPTPPARG